MSLTNECNRMILQILRGSSLQIRFLDWIDLILQPTDALRIESICIFHMRRDEQSLQIYLISDFLNIYKCLSCNYNLVLNIIIYLLFSSDISIPLCLTLPHWVSFSIIRPHCVSPSYVLKESLQFYSLRKFHSSFIYGGFCFLLVIQTSN